MLTKGAFIQTFLFALALIASSGGCSYGDSDQSDKATGVSGSITDTAGSPLSGVDIKAGDATTTTNGDGEFALDLAESDNQGDNLVLRFNKAGYIPAQKRVDVREGVITSISIYMKAEAAAQSLDAAAGGTISAERGAQLTAAANAFVDVDGNQVSGTVDVHLTPFDPSDQAELRAIPDLSAERSDGQQSELESFGVLDVTVRQNGEIIDVKEGETLTIRIPVPAGGSATPPATIALWSFNDQTGLWKEEGTATYLAAEAVYEAEISHMSPWNADIEMETTGIRGRVIDGAGNPVPGAYVYGQGVDYNGMSDANAGANGQFCMLVRKGSLVSVTVYLAEGGGATREVSSGSNTVSADSDCAGWQDAGEWVVETGQYTDSSGQTVNCQDIGSNPLAGTCAEAFWEEFARCFQPSGACTTNLNGETRWENGARIGVLGAGAMEYFGPNGVLCGTAMTDMTSLEDIKTNYTIPSGATFTIKYDTVDPNRIIMVCTDGTEIVFNTQQQESFVACTGGDTTSQAECAIEGMPGGCAGDSDCLNGQICCAVPEAGMSMCLPPEICSQM